MPLPLIGPRLPTLDARRVRPPPKQADPLYLSPEHRAWRAAVLERAGQRCEAVTRQGFRCTVAFPSRLFADHVIEVKDGGAEFDPANGQCLCGSHHSAKTAAARARRR
ncbi:MAG TPA: HNH endonuclease signature motif containing protein [Caulobacteraceae bacterium]|jgi:hypothetical protein